MSARRRFIRRSPSVDRADLDCTARSISSLIALAFSASSRHSHSIVSLRRPRLADPAGHLAAIQVLALHLLHPLAVAFLHCCCSPAIVSSVAVDLKLLARKLNRRIGSRDLGDSYNVDQRSRTRIDAKSTKTDPATCEQTG